MNLNESIYAPRKHELRFKYNRSQQITRNDIDVNDQNLLDDMKDNDVKPNADKRDAEVIADESLPEDHPIEESNNQFEVFGFTKKKRTIDDIREEHLRANANYYNHLFYSPDPTMSSSLIRELPFLDYFYPNMKRLNLYTRMQGAIGGMAFDSKIYDVLHINTPYSENPGEKYRTAAYTPEDLESLKDEIRINYDKNNNWYKSDAADFNHIIFCCKLYSMLYDMLTDQNLDFDQMSAYHTDIMAEWRDRVTGAYDEIKNASTGRWYQMAQILHDLCWYPLDDPDNATDVASCRIAFVNSLASGKEIVRNMNEANAGEMVSKEDTVAYLVKELELGDECFLVPSLQLYPIVNAGSVKMAMDQIDRVEPEYLEEYVRNLNKKYKEFGCTFSISIDHPYAKFADKAIIDNMTRVLMEGDSVANDHGVTTGKEEVEPWYLTKEVRGGETDHDFYPDRNLGPNVGKDNQKEFTKHYSIL